MLLLSFVLLLSLLNEKRKKKERKRERKKKRKNEKKKGKMKEIKNIRMIPPKEKEIILNFVYRPAGQPALLRL